MNLNNTKLFGFLTEESNIETEHDRRPEGTDYKEVNSLQVGTHYSVTDETESGVWHPDYEFLGFDSNAREYVFKSVDGDGGDIFHFITIPKESLAASVRPNESNENVKKKLSEEVEGSEEDLHGSEETETDTDEVKIRTDYKSITEFIREVTRKVDKASLKLKVEIVKKHRLALAKRIESIDESEDLKGLIAPDKMRDMKKLLKEIKKLEDKHTVEYTKKYHKPEKETK
jgi:hypothetical protein